MQKKLFPFFFTCFTASAALMPALQAGSKNATTPTGRYESAAPSSTITSEPAAKAVSRLYDSLHLDRLGLSYAALQYAYRGYEQLKKKGALLNEGILTVIDFSQSSFKKRMYVLDVKNIKVLVHTYVAHGKHTGLQYAEKFSNTPESLQSSLGFYVTRGTYFGKHGLSLRLDGKEPGFNSKALERAIVVHGADYIGAHRLRSAYMGRSFGCPAVPKAEAAKVIHTIKNGSCFFIYHPSKSYLHGSKLLNV